MSIFKRPSTWARALIVLVILPIFWFIPVDDAWPADNLFSVLIVLIGIVAAVFGGIAGIVVLVNAAVGDYD